MTEDLNENMTSEEIAAYAEQVVQEVQQERQGDGERKSDAAIVVDTAAPIETPAEENTGSETASDQGEESGEGSTPEWVTDELKAEVAAYGIDESDLEDFASREDLDRALRLLDKAALRSGQEALTDDGPARDEKGKFVKKEEESEPEKPSSTRYEVSLNKDLYDEEVIDEFTKMRDYYESRLEALESKFTEVSARAEEQEFDQLVDSLGHADLFGKTGKESERELERRRDLHVAVNAQLLGLERLGRSAALNDKLVERVANMVFADELSKKRLKQQTAKISKQSQLRMGGSPTKPQPPSEDPREAADRLYKELERA
jgi:hypothetical protein